MMLTVPRPAWGMQAVSIPARRICSGDRVSARDGDDDWLEVYTVSERSDRTLPQGPSPDHGDELVHISTVQYEGGEGSANIDDWDRRFRPEEGARSGCSTIEGTSAVST